MISRQREKQNPNTENCCIPGCAVNGNPERGPMEVSNVCRVWGKTVCYPHMARLQVWLDGIGFWKNEPAHGPTDSEWKQFLGSLQEQRKTA